MAESSKMVYQFKVTLLGLRPPIWRRIQVPSDFTFQMLHIAIQDSMGWIGSHMHYFYIKKPANRTSITIGDLKRESGIYEMFGSAPEVLCEVKTQLAQYFTHPKTKARYEYDMGDSWEHDVVLEKILPADDGAYPRCIAGKRACPPEDCGGTSGYEELLEIFRDPDHPEHAERKEWCAFQKGDDFDPEKFDSKEVCFQSAEDYQMVEQLIYNIGCA